MITTTTYGNFFTLWHYTFTVSLAALSVQSAFTTSFTLTTKNESHDK